MREYTEPVAEYDGAVIADESKYSWLLPAHAAQMPVNHWVDCEGFSELRIAAQGNGAFDISVYVSPSNPPAPGQPEPARTEIIVLPGVAGNPLAVGDLLVSYTLDLSGMKTVGVQLYNALVGGGTLLTLRAFLLR